MEHPIPLETRELVQVHQPLRQPGIHQVMTRPMEATVPGICCHCQREEPGWLDKFRIRRNKHLIQTCGHANADVRTRLSRFQWQKLFLKPPQERKSRWRHARPGISACEPRLNASSLYT